MENKIDELTVKTEQQLPEDKTEQVSGGQQIIVKEGETLDSALRRFKRKAVKL